MDVHCGAFVLGEELELDLEEVVSVLLADALRLGNAGLVDGRANGCVIVSRATVSFVGRFPV